MSTNRYSKRTFLSAGVSFAALMAIELALGSTSALADGGNGRSNAGGTGGAGGIDGTLAEATGKDATGNSTLNGGGGGGLDLTTGNGAAGGASIRTVGGARGANGITGTTGQTVTIDTILNASVSGGMGTTAPLVAGMPGGQGGGGVGVSAMAKVTVLGGVTITGGAGRATGTQPAGSGGAGGGGAGIFSTSDVTVDATGAVVGGAGGNGNTLGGGGGGGAAAIVLSGNGTLQNSGTLTGGKGGNGSINVGAGDGGAGIRVVSGGTVFNTTTGKITGGLGGTGNSGGDGGAGIKGSNITIINAGEISGGLGSAIGGIAGQAIEFIGGVNTLEIQVGSNIAGNVKAFGAADTFRLGGTTSGTFDVSQIGTGAKYDGFGHFEKTGTGTWTLTGTTAAATAWTLSQGVLSISSDANLGATSGNLTFNGGTLQTTANITSARNVTLAGNGTLLTDVGTVLTLNGIVSGPGGLTKSGMGTLTLTGTNSYSGNTTIAAGALQLGNGSTSGSITGNVVNNAALVFNRSNALTLAGLISGSGSVQQVGGGVTTLTGANSYAGATLVTNGTLLVNGNQTAATGLTLVASGASLGGNGTIGGDVTINNNATLAPGDAGAAPGTLTINGNLNLNENSNLAYDFGQANVAGGAFNDLVKVGGDLTLNGTLNIAMAPGGTFGPGVYRIASYSGTLSDNGLNVGSLPAGTLPGTVFVQTAVDKQVNLVNTAGLTFSYWDPINPPSNPGNNGRVDGGSGIWRNDVANNGWATRDGVVNAPWTNGNFAVFQAAAGTVTVDNSGAAPVTVAGMQFATNGYVVTGDALTLAGSPDSVIRVGDGTSDGAGYTATISAVLQGNSRLTKTDLGTLVLGGINTYTGGTAINGGMLQISADANLGAASGGLSLDGGTLRTTADITSTRSLTANGNGGLLTGAGTTLTLSGSIAGNGSLAKTGTGTLKLTGDSSAFVGKTTVGQGILSVDGKLGGTLDVLAGGRLQGNGTIGGLSVANGGVVAPGNSIGTLNVAGDVAFAAGSTYEVEIAGNGTGDRITATGKATLGGGTVAVTALDAQTSYQASQTYTILTAAGGVTGGFDPSVLARSAFLDASLIQSANAVDLKIGIRGSKPEEPGGEKPVFGKAANTYNQKRTAGALDTLQQSGAPLALYNKLLVLSADEGRAAFDSLSGEVHASTVTGLIEDSRFTREAINDRLRSAFETVGAEPLPLMGYGDDTKEITTASVASERYGAWGSVFGSWGHFGSDGNAAKLNRSIGGFVTGVDGLITDDVRLGFMAGYSHSSLKVDERRSSASTDNYHLGIYGGTELGALSLRSGLAYTWSQIDTSRQVSFPGFSDSLTGDYRAGTTQVFGELGYGLKAGAVAFEPFANLAYINVHTNGFTEQGGASALTVHSGSNDSTFTTLGIRAATDFDIGTAKATVRGMIGWRHAYGDVTPDISQAFTGSSAFSIAGTPIARDAAVIEAGLDFAIAPQATLGVSYHGQVGSKASDHGVRADLNVKF